MKNVQKIYERRRRENFYQLRRRQEHFELMRHRREFSLTLVLLVVMYCAITCNYFNSVHAYSRIKLLGKPLPAKYVPTYVQYHPTYLPTYLPTTCVKTPTGWGRGGSILRPTYLPPASYLPTNPLHTLRLKSGIIYTFLDLLNNIRTLRVDRP